MPPKDMKSSLVGQRGQLGTVTATGPDFTFRPPTRLLKPQLRDAVIPVSAAQASILKLACELGQADDNVSFLVTLPGPARPEAVREALARAVERHEILRTTIVRGDGADAQIVHDELAPSFEVCDLSGFEGLSRERFRSEHLLPHSLTRIDHQRASPIAAKLFILPRQQQILSVVSTRLHLDPMSQRMLSAELIMRYQGQTSGMWSEPEPLEVQYADFAIWERQWATPAARAYWRENLPAFATSSPTWTSSCPSIERGVLNLDLTADPLESLRLRAAEADVSLLNAVMAMMCAALARQNGLMQIAVGYLMNGRPAGAESVLGPFARLRPYCLMFDDDVDLDRLLTAAREADYAATDIEHPVDLDLQIAAGLHRVIITGTLLPEDLHDSVGGSPKNQTRILQDASQPFYPNLVCQFIETPSSLKLQIEWNPQVVDTSSVEKLAAAFTQTACKASDSPFTPLSLLVRLHA